MDSKKINYLVSQSYKEDSLDVNKVNAIAALINRSSLKKYLSALKRKEKTNSVVIVSPFDNGEKEVFKKTFPNKKIVCRTDPSLITGVKIIDNDIVYELNLKNTLNSMIDHIQETYD